VASVKSFDLGEHPRDDASADQDGQRGAERDLAGGEEERESKAPEVAGAFLGQDG
jgi:hypothetical protein